MSSTVQVSSRSTVTPDAVQRSLRLSVIDGLLHAVTLGLSESYIGAFAVELGHRDAALALLMTVPMLIGAAGQLMTATYSVMFLIALFVRLVSVGALALKIDPDAAVVRTHST